MRSSSKSKKGIGCLVVIGLLLLGGLIQSIVRYLNDKPLYTEAHAAYLVGQCETAIPIFEQITDTTNVFDLGKFKMNSRAELGNCVVFQSSVENGLSGLYDFAHNRPDNPLTAIAKVKAGEIFASLNDGSVLDEELGEEACSRKDELAALGFLDDETAITKYLFYCAVLQSEKDRVDDAYSHLTTLMRDYPDSEMADGVLQFMRTYISLCPLLNNMENDPLFNNDSNSITEYYLACVESYVAWNDFGYGYSDAITFFEAFLEKFPDNPAKSEVENALANAFILQAREAGSGVIERPDPSGSAPEGVARVVIQNDSPHELKIIFSGPDTLIEQLPACPECRDYYNIGPTYCPEMGPVGTYELPPGTYEVLVETVIEEDIVPFTGTWELIGGNEFYSCFFVVTSSY